MHAEMLLSLAHQGNHEARQELFMEFLPCAKRATANLLYKHTRLLNDWDDYLSEARLIMWEKLLTWEPSKYKAQTHYIWITHMGLMDYMNRSSESGGLKFTVREKKKKEHIHIMRCTLHDDFLVEHFQLHDDFLDMRLTQEDLVKIAHRAKQNGLVRSDEVFQYVKDELRHIRAG